MSAESKPPPSSGALAYNTFVPPRGGIYPDPVFGSSVIRLTDDHARDDMYARNMCWSADGQRYLHRTNAVLGVADAWDVVDVARGVVTHHGIGFGTIAADGGFDPVDADALYALNNRTIDRIALRNDGSWARAPMFDAPAQLFGLGGSINWLNADGRFMLVRYGAEKSSALAYVYDRDKLAAGPYAHPIDASRYVETGGYLGLSPDGAYVVGFEGGRLGASGVGQAVTWRIDHMLRSVAATPVICWSLCGDHGAYASCSDGRTYFVSYSCFGHAGVWRADVTNNADGLDEAAQMALPNNKLLLDFGSGAEAWKNFGHVATIARGDRRDWALISTEDSSDLADGATAPWHPYRQEIIALHILSGEVKRLAHHRSRSIGDDYYAQPRVSASWSGGAVGFASNYNQPGVVDAHAILLAPLDAPKPPEPTPPPATGEIPVTITLGPRTYTGTVKETNMIPTLLCLLGGLISLAIVALVLWVIWWAFTTILAAWNVTIPPKVVMLAQVLAVLILVYIVVTMLYAGSFCGVLPVVADGNGAASPLTSLAALESRLAALWRPPRRLSLAAWADAEFQLPAGDANAGRWRTLPYQRGLLDAMTDPTIERVIIMKSARVGYTKAFCAFVAYHIAHDPCPILVVQPTLDDAKKHSKEDIAPMLAELPSLRGLVAPAKSHDSDNTILDKIFRGGSLSLVGANSPRGFRRTSRRVVIFDEVDGYKLGAGDEGDQIELGVRRSEYYWNRKILVGSTPTLAGYSRIERLFIEGDQRRRYLPCPTCGAFQVLKLANLKWPAGKPERAHLRCVARGCEIEHKQKREMDEAGEWRADAPGHFTPEHRHASFHIWAGYSHSPNATWGHIAAEFVKSQHAGALVFQTFVNTWLGETFRERGEAPPWEPLMLRRSSYKIGTVPSGALFLTAGVDVQRDRLVYEVVGWGRGKRSWSIDAGTLLGDTSDLERGPWGALDSLLARSFARVAGGALSIAKLAVDSGYNTQVVYSWARRYPRSRVIAIKGVAHGENIVGYDKPIEFTAGGKRLRRGYRVIAVVGRIAKDELYGFLNLKPPADGVASPPGYCEFPEYDEEFFKQLTSEELIRVKGRLEWAQIPGRSNDALDARVYARAAAAKHDIGIDSFGEWHWRRLELALERAPAPTAPDEPEEPEPETAPPTPWTREPSARPFLSPRRPGSYWRR